MFGHVIATGFGSNLQQMRFFNVILATYRWRNIYIVYDTEGLPYLAKGAQGIHNLNRGGNRVISTLKSVNSSDPESYNTTLADFRKVARGERQRIAKRINDREGRFDYSSALHGSSDNPAEAHGI